MIFRFYGVVAQNRIPLILKLSGNFIAWLEVRLKLIPLNENIFVTSVRIENESHEIQLKHVKKSYFEKKSHIYLRVILVMRIVLV